MAFPKSSVLEGGDEESVTFAPGDTNAGDTIVLPGFWAGIAPNGGTRSVDTGIKGVSRIRAAIVSSAIVYTQTDFDPETFTVATPSSMGVQQITSGSFKLGDDTTAEDLLVLHYLRAPETATQKPAPVPAP